MRPRALVEEWVRRFNAADSVGLATLYAEDAVNHQVTQDPVEGRAAIRAMFEREFAAADMTCIIEPSMKPATLRPSSGATRWACAAAASSL
jgi:uncharacterized protein (TIGR02246 family)